jgi:hypothetical protein
MKPPHPDEPPPLLGSWRRVYWAVAFYLFLVIVALTVFTRTYNQ